MSSLRVDSRHRNTRSARTDTRARGREAVHVHCQRIGAVGIDRAPPLSHGRAREFRGGGSRDRRTRATFTRDVHSLIPRWGNSCRPGERIRRGWLLAEGGTGIYGLRGLVRGEPALFGAFPAFPGRDLGSCRNVYLLGNYSTFTHFSKMNWKL